jgi:NAD(P)-dependent dehydrogenase (short-subunit alcohol dehydrogenase family)
MSDEEVDYDSFTVAELKARIKRGGLKFADCVDKSDLRRRAREADSKSNNVRCGKENPPAPKLRERRQAPGASAIISEEESQLLEKATALATESTKVISGRDASVILDEAKGLREKVEAAASLTETGKRKILASLDEVEKGLGFENALEKNCGRVIQIGMMAMMILPMLFTFIENFTEFWTRPVMAVDQADLLNTNAVITGGCGAVGVELAIMLAKSGAGVVIACHGAKMSEEDKVEARLAKLGLLRTKNSDRGWIETWHLELESFESVREFAERASKEMKNIDILVHNAATKEGCSKTVDGYELGTQVNYLSPFLLTQLLRPKFQTSSRVVHVTCDAGLQRADWLPWPFRRTETELLPRIDLDGLDERETIASSCSPLIQYANAKLAIIAHSHGLNRRLIYDDQGISHVVNPGSVDSAFGRSESVPTKPSARSSMMAMLPPVWIAQKLYSFTIGKVVSASSNFMLRQPNVGAKAVFHVATSTALADAETGGGLFSDRAGAFTDCGKAPEDCGRVQPHEQPLTATDGDLADELWTRTENAIGSQTLRPVGA